MINVNQMTAAFAKMPDAALKQYAMMHKNDPYTMSLAMSESNRRKQIRDSAQGQAAQQPTVVDQGIEQMDAPKQMAQALPENTGIGTLPQQPMQMAEGGIVAFAEGGKASWEYELDALVNPESAEQRPGNMSAWEAAKRAFLYSSDLEAQRAQRPVTPDALAAQSAMQAGGGRGTMQNDPRLAPGFSPTPEFVKTPTVDKGGLKDLAAASPRAAAKQLGFADRMDAGMGKAPDFEARIKENTAAEAKLAREGLARTKEDQAAEMKSMFTGQEGRLAKREAELGKSKDTNIAMALIQGGLSMIKPGPAMQAIASGALVGTKQYGEGIAQIKASQEKLDDARDRMENLRNSATSMNNREIRGEEKGIRDLLARGQREQLAGAEKAYGIKREDMRAAVASDIAVEQAGLDRQNRIAVASMPGDQQRMLTTLGGEAGLAGGLAKMQEIQTDKTGAAYAKLFTETVAEANKVGAVPPTAAQFAASLRSLAAALNPTKVPPPVDATGASRS